MEEGLKTNAADSRPRDGRILIREWLDYATKRVPEMQAAELDREAKQGRLLQQIKFAETDQGSERSVQRPRVFYRRELEPHPLVISTATASVANVTNAPSANNSPARSNPVISAQDGEAAFWARIEHSTDPRDFEEYLAAYPDGNFAPVARLTVRKLREAAGGAVTPSGPTSSTVGTDPRLANITALTIESKYNQGAYADVINDAGLFLESQPDNAKVNMMMGFSLMNQQREPEAYPYLDRGFRNGETISINVRRHRLIGPLLQEGVVLITPDGLAMGYGDERYHAAYSAIEIVQAMNYGASGIGVMIKGKFINAKGKEEKKEFNLFAPSAGIGQSVNVWGTVPMVVCQNCEAWSFLLVNLFNHFRGFRM